MSEPVLFEVVIAAPADTVWRALRDRSEVRRWFGWDYDGIDDEIEMIFFGDAAVDDDVNEGWLTFTQQLRFMLERHPGADRETVHIPLTGDPWFETENQVGVINDGRLIIRTPERVIMSRYD